MYCRSTKTIGYMFLYQKIPEKIRFFAEYICVSFCFIICVMNFIVPQSIKGIQLSIKMIEDKYN